MPLGRRRRPTSPRGTLALRRPFARRQRSWRSRSPRARGLRRAGRVARRCRTRLRASRRTATCRISAADARHAARCVLARTGSAPGRTSDRCTATRGPAAARDRRSRSASTSRQTAAVGERTSAAWRRTSARRLDDLDASAWPLARATSTPARLSALTVELTLDGDVLIGVDRHVLRFELELALVDGLAGRSTTSAQAWDRRAMTQDLLGVDVPDDADGVLQDIHWASASRLLPDRTPLGNGSVAAAAGGAHGDRATRDRARPRPSVRPAARVAARERPPPTGARDAARRGRSSSGATAGPLDPAPLLELTARRSTRPLYDLALS